MRGLRLCAGAVDQVGEPDAVPALGRVEASRAVERRDQGVAGAQLVERDRELVVDEAGQREPERRLIQLARVVGYPRGGRERVPLERRGLVRAGEAATRRA